jgi:hypothetical protein
MPSTDQDSGVPKVEQPMTAADRPPNGLGHGQEGTDSAMSDGVDSLRLEVERLRDLVGPDELDYNSLKLELWRVRDTVIGMEAELGNVRGRCLVLERDRENAARSRVIPELETREGFDDFIAAAAKRARAFRDRGHQK